MTLDSKNSNYQRTDPIGDYFFFETVTSNLPSKPKIVLVNLFGVNSKQTKEEKVEFL